MRHFKEWFKTMTLGQTKKYLQLLLWCLFDSFVVSIPYAVMVLAVYVLLMPIASPEISLPADRIWILTGILVVQAIAYLFIRKKSYLDFCIGFAGTTKTSRIEMGEHLRKLSMGFFSSRDAGDLSTVLLRDYTEIETFAQQILPQAATVLIRFTLAIIALSAFNIKMMAAVFAVIPLSLPFALLSMKRMEKEGAELQQAQQEAASGILEYVGGIRTLKAFNMAGGHFETLKTTLDNQRKASINIETKAALPVSMLGRFTLNCGISVVMLTGTFLMINNELPPFYFIAFLLLTLTIYDPVLSLFTFIADLSRTTRSGRRIRSLFEEKPLQEPSVSAVSKSSDIEFKNVSFGYGNKEVLHDISLSFPAKTVTALVGPSGSGKSTITRLIARFWDADSGEILFGGVPVKELKTEDLIGNISMVFQDVYLFQDTVEANIKMGKSDASREEVVEAAKRACCHDFIMALPDGYNTMIGEGGSTLSGGEKQRISIARALLKDASVILLDEATSSLDPENEVLIQHAISELVADKTVIVIAHRLQSVCNADQIVVLQDGKIAEQGTHQQLLTSDGLYTKLWKEQNHAGSWRIRE
ncbi:MAG: ABC transporter ATP-binding protein/permease [Oscillospiraceae bacterium]|nr:ABC transporter ATP-binding protein/permease [Oscillospiraceae bacterium]